MTAAEPVTSDPRAEAFYGGALERISRCMLLLGLILSPLAGWRYGWPVALGFVCGCSVACLNFHWLKKVVTALADRVTESNRPPSSKGVVLRFLLRYLLMGLGAYVIFKLSPASLYGLFAGLFLPVAAIACEAAYEAWVAVTRGI